MHTQPLASAHWQFREASTRKPWRDAVVPGCVHLDLLRHRLIPDPFFGSNELQLQWIEERDWEYRITFDLAGSLQDEEVIDLVADGLDTLAIVTLNGTQVAATENMFQHHRWDVKHLLRPGDNELHVRFGSAMRNIRAERTTHQPVEFNDPVGRCSVIRKEQCQFGWDWGPRLVTAGIWQDIRLEGWSGNRIESIRVAQAHRADGSVELTLAPELARSDSRVVLRGTLSLGETHVATLSNLTFQVANPRLWWPNGHGPQPLYTIEVEVLGRSGDFIGVWKRRIGLRTIILDRHPDEWGESFQFVVNDRPIFAKGANWIPAHSFVAGLDRSDYERDLRSAARVHMNMIRVWGGGIYESEHFYDVCDELGLLVWQDFMFACTRYPADDAFRASVRIEAAQQVRRLRHRACLALWCGNNEIAGLNRTDIDARPALRAEYDALFHEDLPAAVAAHDAVTPYWPSSPWRANGGHAHTDGEASGDTHFWDVWHLRKPVKDYERYAFRFCSEFGMQSFPSPESIASFAAPDDRNVFGPTMRNHQKNRAGNQVILDYVSRLYRFPEGQDALIYLSQLNQAHCMQVGVEHYRRNMPRCMGALYWQLNDCWPVASWSSIEFSGRWRALHHVARRFFAPALVSAHVPGDEHDIIGNYRRSDVHAVHIYTVYDAPEPARGTLVWDLFHLDGRRLAHGRRKVDLRYGESVRHHTLELARPLEKHGRDELYLRIALDIGGTRMSEDTVFLTAPRFLHLHKTRTAISVKSTSTRTATVTFRSPAFQHRFAFDLPEVAYETSDNYFELYPDEPKSVELTFSRPMTATRIKKLLTHRSLVDTY